MSCLGGTVDAPRDWVRLRPDGTIEQHAGRVCSRTLDWTSRRYCSPCPAYRGIKTDTSQATGLYPSGEPYALSARDHELYSAAMDAALIEDDFSLIAAFEARLQEGIGDRTLRAIGDPDALDRHARYMRDYRAANPERIKAQNAAASRAYRARKTVSNHPAEAIPKAGEVLGLSGHARARARSRVITDGREEKP